MAVHQQITNKAARTGATTAPGIDNITNVITVVPAILDVTRVFCSVNIIHIVLSALYLSSSTNKNLESHC